MKTKTGLRAQLFMAAAGLAVAIAAAPAHAAGTIDNTSNVNGAATWDFYTIEQSFAALGTNLDFFGILANVANPVSPDAPITFTLLKDAAVLGSSSVAPTGLTNSIFDGNLVGTNGFDGIGLVMGDNYVMRISGGSARYAFGLEFGNHYADGQAAITGRIPLFSGLTVCPTGVCDGSFVAEFSGGDVGGVPEPATWALMIGGFGLAGAALRHRRTRAALA